MIKINSEIKIKKLKNNIKPNKLILYSYNLLSLVACSLE